MTGIEALQELFEGRKVYRGFVQSDCEQWYIDYNKDTKSFSFGPGWNESFKYKNSQEIMNFIFHIINSNNWQKSSE